jgi:acetyltransferase-like isoleucine patch superfamily enzyme
MNNIIESTLPENIILGNYITIQKNVSIGPGTRISNFANLYGCTIGNDCMIGAFVEIQSNVKIGDRSRISSHSFVCSKVNIGEDCFIGHGVMFINDLFSNNQISRDSDDWKETYIEDNVLIGSNATILPVKIGKGAIIGAGAVVTKDVPAGTIVLGNPAKLTY